MVFNNAEAQTADAGYTSFLSRLGNRTTSSVPSRPLPKTATNGTSSPTSTNQSVKPNGTTTAKPSNGLKRKAEEDLAVARPKKAQETGNSTSASASKPAEPVKAPKKGSYMELLQRAKTAPKVPVGTIVNKPKVAVEPIKKEWQKKIHEERAAKAGAAVAGRTSKSPGVISGGEKPGPGAKGTDKGGPLAKRPGVEAAGSLKRSATGGLAERKSTTPGAGAASSSKLKAGSGDLKARTSAAIREKGRSPPPVRRASKDDYPPKGGRASIYNKPKPMQKQYTYRDETDSDSDMEATGIDILEEEELSAKRARLEDLEQERLEKKLAAEKAARRKMGKK